MSDAGKPIAPNDHAWERLQAVAEAARALPSAWLVMDDIYGAVSESPVFQASFAEWLTGLWSDGTEATLRRYLGS